MLIHFTREDILAEYYTLQIRAQSADTSKDSTTWGLPDEAIARLGRGRVTSLAFSSDRKYLAVGTWIGIWWYDIATWSPIGLWETERGVISALDFSTNGKYLATGNLDATIKIWNLQREKCTARIKLPIQRYETGWIEIGISTVVFSANSQYIAVSRLGNGVICLWNAETGAQITEFSAPLNLTIGRSRGVERPLCFSPSGHYLAFASPSDTDGTSDFVSVWDVKIGKQIAAFKENTNLVHTLDFSPCGQFLAAGDASGTLREWDVSNKKLLRTSSEYDAKYWVIPSYSQSGKLLAATKCQSTIAVWDVDCGRKLNTFEHRGDIHAVRFSNGTHLAVAGPLDINVWTADKTHATSISEHSYYPDFVTFSPNGQTLVSTGSGEVACWDVAKKLNWQTISLSETTIHCIYFSPTGNINAMSNTGNTFNVWNVKTNKIIATFTGHEKQVNAAAFAPKGKRWAYGDIEGKLYVWDRSGKQLPLLGHTNSIETLAFHPNKKQLASGSRDSTVRLWNVVSGKEIAVFPLTQLDAELYLGDPHQKQRLMRIQHNRAERGETIYRSIEIRAIDFSPCGNIIAGGLSREIRLWDTATHDIRAAILLPRECERPYALAFSPCGRYLASGSWWAGTEKVSIRLWDLAACENIHTFWGHPTDIQDLAFSPDGALLASGSYDGTILLWDMEPFIGS